MGYSQVLRADEALFSLGWQSSRDGVSIKINHGVNRAGHVGEGSSPGRCFLVRQRGPVRHSTTVRIKWSKNMNKIVMECFFRSKPSDDGGKLIRGHRQRRMQEWKEHGFFEITE